MRISEVPVGCVIEFIEEKPLTCGSQYKILDSQKALSSIGSFMRITFEALDYLERSGNPARWTLFLIDGDTPVDIVGGFEFYEAAQPCNQEEIDKAKKALLNLTGESCTNGVTLDTKVPSVIFLPDTVVIM